jgi:AraC family ethanolamine operon transcriptional activator
MAPATARQHSSPQAGFSGLFEFDDFDAIRGLAPGWDLTQFQIGQGPTHVRISMAQTSRMSLAVVGRSPGVLERGTPPPGMAALSINLRGSRFHGQGLHWGRDQLAFIPGGVQYEFLSTGPSTLFTVCVRQERLDEVIRGQSWAPFPASVAGPCFRFRDEAGRHALVGTWSRWLARARRNPETVCDTASVERMEEEVLRSVLSNVVPESDGPPLRPYRHLALRVESYIRRSLEEQITVEDICAATNASARSVHASFQMIFGIPPKAYWKALRLAGAREDLKRARKGVTVSDVAAKWNFFRFGYFAIDYRETFGENPRDTLHRTLRRRAAPGSSPDGRPFLSGDP